MRLECAPAVEDARPPGRRGSVSTLEGGCPQPPRAYTGQAPTLRLPPDFVESTLIRPFLRCAGQPLADGIHSDIGELLVVMGEITDLCVPAIVLPVVLEGGVLVACHTFPILDPLLHVGRIQLARDAKQVGMLCEVPNYVKLSLPWPHFPLVFLGFTPFFPDITAHNSML